MMKLFNAFLIMFFLSNYAFAKLSSSKIYLESDIKLEEVVDFLKNSPVAKMPLDILKATMGMSYKDFLKELNFKPTKFTMGGQENSVALLRVDRNTLKESEFKENEIPLLDGSKDTIDITKTNDNMDIIIKGQVGIFGQHPFFSAIFIDGKLIYFKLDSGLPDASSEKSDTHVMVDAFGEKFKEKFASLRVQTLDEKQACKKQNVCSYRFASALRGSDGSFIEIGGFKNNFGSRVQTLEFKDKGWDNFIDNLQKNAQDAAQKQKEDKINKRNSNL